MLQPIFLVLVGTKAQFIKTAPILREFDRRGVPYSLVYTGQHKETFHLLEATFQTRTPDEILVQADEASTRSTFLRWAVRYWVEALRRIARGDWKHYRLAIVHGDTASTLFGALAARLSGVPVAHVEAGLRSPRLFDPFPEEIIRRFVSRLSSLHFAPDRTAAANLRKASGKVVETGGNSLGDALAVALDRCGDLPSHGGHGNYGVVSLHRNENLQSAAHFNLLMEEIARAATRVSLRFVLHPATRERLNSTGWGERLERTDGLQLVDRMDYPDFIKLLIGANFLMTDGGSNQEEATMLGLPTLLLRRVTERQDGLGDVVEVSDLDRSNIRRFVNRYCAFRWRVRIRDHSESATMRIVDSLEEVVARQSELVLL